MSYHINFYANNIKPLNFCGKQIGFEITGSELIKPFIIKPTKGRHDFRTCDNCSKNLLTYTEQFTQRYFGFEDIKKSFPMCCTQHMNLVKYNEFNIKDYNQVPTITAEKVIYTYQHIINNIDNQNWFDEIRSYLEYVVLSFGKMPVDCGEPLFLGAYFDLIIRFINLQSNEPAAKIRALLKCIKDFQLPQNIETDLASLIETYEKWLTIFPFQTLKFDDLKRNFEKRIPLLKKGTISKNKYTGFTSSQIHSKTSLVTFLNDLTKELLDQINIPELRIRGELDDLQATRLQYLDECLRIETTQITKDFTNGELEYLNVLSKWFKLHKEYFKEIQNL